MGTQSDEERFDELLNGYIDDELTTRQHVEVERLIAHDAKVEKRLKQLQKCKALISSMPIAEAPPQILKGVQATMAYTARLYEQPSHNRRVGRIHLLARKVLSAAAMLALAALLGAVIYTILAPESALEGPNIVKAPPPLKNLENNEETVTPPTVNLPALAFSGKLELKTSIPAEVGAIISATIKENGLSDSFGDIRKPNTQIHYLKCSREGLNSLLASLDSVWPKLDSATMAIDTDVFNRPVTIDAITTEQISEIIDQKSHEKRAALAKDFNLINTTTATIPGTEVLTAINTETADMMTIPKPVLVGPSTRKTPDQPESSKTIRLTIILSR